MPGSESRDRGRPLQPPLEVSGSAARLQSLRTAASMDDLKRLLVALCAAAAVGLASVIFVLIWALHFKEGLAWDGGLAEFNWHPVLMVTGFIFLQGIGEDSFFFPLKKCGGQDWSLVF